MIFLPWSCVICTVRENTTDRCLPLTVTGTVAGSIGTKRSPLSHWIGEKHRQTILFILLYIEIGLVALKGTVPPVLLTPVANLQQVSTTPPVPVAKFAAGVVDTSGAP
jgi:hypothetical protein